jgi:hypothetical protein
MVEAHESVGGATKRGKPDPGVVMPPAVKAAAQRSEELMRQAKEAKAANEAAGGSEPALQPGSVPQSPPPASGVQMTNFNPARPEPPPEPPKQPAEPPASPTPQADPNWEHQFNSLKGRYEREQENNRRIARQLADTQHLLASVNSAQPQPQPQPAQQQNSGVQFNSPMAQPRYVTPQEVKEYGEELMDVVGRRAREVYEPIVAQLTNELNTVRQQVGGVRNSVSYDASVKMYENLAKEVPDWESINGSPEFGRWLDQPDPMTGQIRRNILAYSHRNNMTSNVVAAFKGFLSDQASSSPAPNGAVPGNGADGNTPVASTPQTDLKQFAAPGRAKTGQTQVSPEKPIFSTADITQFYRDKTAGKFAGREAEADALERSLYEAGREGRIRR